MKSIIRFIFFMLLAPLACAQAIDLGHIKDLAEGRQIIRNSFDLETYTPQQTDQWDQQYERFMKLKETYRRHSK